MSEIRDQVLEPDANKMTGEMLVVCSACKVFIGTKPCMPEYDGKHSHSYCKKCFEKVMAEIKGYNSMRFAPCTVRD